MTRAHPWYRALAVAVAVAVAVVVALPLAASAQERGRTDGPEGSEYGKGGYAEPSGGMRAFSLQLDWGYASVPQNPLGGTPGTPLFVGLTGAFWATDWFLVEASGQYIVPNTHFNLLVGPRFRTATYPLSGYLGLKAGAIFTSGGLRFGLSPTVGADFLLKQHYLLGLGYAPDFALGSNAETTHRVFMTLGYRF